MTKRLDYNQIAPNGSKALGGVYGYVMQSGLPAELVELVYLRVSQINNCAYWLDMHNRDLAKTGLPIEKLALGRRRQSLYRQRARRPGLGRDRDRCGPNRCAGRSMPGAVFGEKKLVVPHDRVSLLNAYNHMAHFRNTPRRQSKTKRSAPPPGR